MIENRYLRLRKALGMTQQQFAVAASLSMASVQNYEKGLEPSHNTLMRLVNLALEHGLAELAVELQGGEVAVVREFPPKGSRPRLPETPGSISLQDELHRAVDLVLQSGDPEAVGALESLLAEISTRATRTITGEGAKARSPALHGDILRKSRGNQKWHELLNIILNSRFRKAIEENLTSFSDGLQAERALAELQRRVNSGEFSGSLSSDPAAPNRDTGIKDAERAAAQAESIEKEANAIAEELRRTGTAHPRRTEQRKPPKTGSGGSHGRRS